MFVCECQIILAEDLGQDSGGERETFVSNQRKWRAVDRPRIFSKLVSLLDMERPTELISSQDSNNRKKKETQKIKPFLSNKTIQEINVMYVMHKIHNKIITTSLKWDKQCYLGRAVTES